jgi:prepilin-type N-terminal cleavage/methylation domain-containing protein
MRKLDIKTRKQSETYGFTMVEILVAMVVLAIGLLGMAGMTILVMQGNRGAVDMTSATNLCQHKIEELKDVQWSDVGTFSLSSDAENAIEFGAEGSVEPGNVNALNAQGMTKQQFYVNEQGVAGSYCNGSTAPTWDLVTDTACAELLKNSGPYKYARTFVVCKGSDYTLMGGVPKPPDGSTATAPPAPAGSAHPETEPDCLVNANNAATRTESIACSAGDITSDLAIPADNNEKKLKALCAWRDRQGVCHSVHIETTIVKF